MNTDPRHCILSFYGMVKRRKSAEIALGFERLGNKIDHLSGEIATLKEMFAAHPREHHGVK